MYIYMASLTHMCIFRNHINMSIKVMDKLKCCYILFPKHGHLRMPSLCSQNYSICSKTAKSNLFLIKPGIINHKNLSSKRFEGIKKYFTAKHAWKLGLLAMGSNVLLIFFYFGGTPRDADGEEILRDEFSDLPKWKAYPQRFMKQTTYYKKTIEEPSRKTLLPDPVKEPYYQPPYTLVIELTGVLVHPDWTLNTGWRFKKRPHIDYLLTALQSPGLPLFEIVVYTHEQGMTAYPIIDGIDPRGHVSYRLFRDSTRFVNNSHCKDLSCINRDETKVIIVDCDPKAVQLQPRNSVNLTKWNGADGDTTLIDLAHFLRTIAASGVEDVRTVLDYYNQFDDPLETFKQNQKQAQEQEMAAKSSDPSKNKGFIGNWSAGFGRRR